MRVRAAALARGLGRLERALPAASGAMVMGTGIVSIALFLDKREALSLALLAIDCLAWALLAVVLGGRLVWRFDRVRSEARSPTALTGVAGTAVLGTRLALAGLGGAGYGALAIALVLWLALLPVVLAHLQLPSTGITLLLTVSTQSLAVLAAALADLQHASWLLYASLPLFLLGLAFYLFVIARFDLRQLLTGSGDHWITGGALAISTLAAGRITLAIKSLHVLGGLHGAAQATSLALWAVTMLWLPALLIAEALSVRPRYSVRRWSTLFPVGMYAACSFIAGAAAGVAALGDFARVWVWAGVALWALLAIGMLRRGAQIARSA